MDSKLQLVADTIAQKIMDDLDDRSGILDGVDDDIRADMYSVMRAIVLSNIPQQAARAQSRADVVEEDAKRYRKLKSMPEEMALFWITAYRRDDSALDAALAQKEEPSCACDSPKFQCTDQPNCKAKKECPVCTGNGHLPEGAAESDAHHYLFCAQCGKPNKPIA